MIKEKYANKVLLEGIISNVIHIKTYNHMYKILLKVQGSSGGEQRPEGKVLVRCHLYLDKEVRIKKGDPLSLMGRLEEDVWGMYVHVLEYNASFRKALY